MCASNDEIWNAAEFLTEWKDDDYTYKLFEVHRTAIDEDADEENAHLLIGLDSGNVRRLDVLLDTAYGRTIDAEKLDRVRVACETADEDAAETLAKYL